MTVLEQVSDTLWLADIEGVQVNETAFADRVVSVCQDSAEDNVGVRYSHVPLADNIQNSREYGGSASYGRFRLAVDLVRAGMAVGETLVVHCHRGRNRSGAVVAAALATDSGMSYDEAFDIITEVRPEANPGTTMKYHAKHYIDENS